MLVSAPIYDCKLTTIMLHTDRQQVAMPLQELYDAAFVQLEAAVERDKSGQVEDAIERYEAALASFQSILNVEEAADRRAVIQRKLSEHRARLADLKAAQGDKAFEAAIKLDEEGQRCIEAYMRAVELYLPAIKLFEQQEWKQAESEARRLKARVAKVLDRVELKKTGKRPSSEAPQSAALPAAATPPAPAPSSSSSTFDLADLPLPPTTLPPNMPAAAPAPRPSSSSNGSPSLPPPPPRPTAPAAATPKLTPAEIEVLKRSSTINGRVFLPWLDGEELMEDFSPGQDGTPFSDPDGLFRLSPQQTARLGGWKRPAQFVGAGQQPRMIKAINPFSIEQDIVGDCSFIASLIICAAHERRHKKPLVSNIIFPQDGRGQPVYNPSGKYMVKLWANGCARKVIVDDRLPVDRNGELLCACSTDRTELWVSIIEKAYMKLHGASYNFGGSNSCIDLFSFTGWIPEQIFFAEDDEAASSASSSRRSSTGGGGGGDGGVRRRPPVLDHRQPAERAWERLRSAFRFGDCLTTIATSGGLDEREAEALGLVPGHAYAVLDVREVLGKRFLLVKNPWARKSWKGPYSALDRARWTPELCAALGYDPEAARKVDDGVFWIDWAHARVYFNNLFLNWNPDLFLFRTFTHALWPAAVGPRNDSFNYGLNPQYLLSFEKGGGGGGGGGASVWILLTRHVTAEEDLEAADYLTLHVYRGGKRVIYPSEGRVCQGVYSNNPHVLTRLDVDPAAAAAGAGAAAAEYALVLSQYEKAHDLAFTLSVFATGPFTLRPAPPVPPVAAQLEGVWTRESAGGRLGQPGFMHNPQFRLVVNRLSRLFVELLAPKDFFVSFSLIGGHRGGRRVDSILQGEEALTSGVYRQGYCFAECSQPLAPGMYTAVVSTYEAGLTGAFVLNVRSEAPLQQATSLLPEGDGMVKNVLRGAWSAVDGTAGGSRPPLYVTNPTFSLACTERARVLLRLVCAGGANEPINVTLFQGASLPPLTYASAEGTGVVGTAHGAVYTACSCGVATAAIELDAGSPYLAVCACYDEGVEAPFELIVYSSKTLSVARVR